MVWYCRLEYLAPFSDDVRHLTCKRLIQKIYTWFSLSRYSQLNLNAWRTHKLFYNLAELRVTNSWERDDANYCRHDPNYRFEKKVNFFGLRAEEIFYLLPEIGSEYAESRYRSAVKFRFKMINKNTCKIANLGWERRRESGTWSLKLHWQMMKRTLRPCRQTIAVAEAFVNENLNW